MGDLDYDSIKIHIFQMSPLYQASEGLEDVQSAYRATTVTVGQKNSMLCAHAPRVGSVWGNTQRRSAVSCVLQMMNGVTEE